MGDDADTLVARINEYLSAGGLFNPELADHQAVRDLLTDCRDFLSASPDESWKRVNTPWGVS